MRNLLIVFFVIIFLILIITFPFKTRLMGHINLLEMKGFYSFKVWRVKLLCGKIFLNNLNEFEIQNSNNMLNGEIDKNFLGALSKDVIKKLEIEKIELFFTGGVSENSFMSAMMCGTVLSLIQTLYGYLSEQYECVHLYEDIVPTYNENNFELTFDIVVKISLFQICLSLIKAQKIKIRMEKIENEG